MVLQKFPRVGSVRLSVGVSAIFLGFKVYGVSMICVANASNIRWIPQILHDPKYLKP